MCTTTKVNSDLVTIKKLALEYMSNDFVYRGNVYNMAKLGWRFVFHTKKTALGTCSKSRKTVALSSWIIENSENPLSTWKNTILHEIAHAIDFEVRGKSSHDWQWRSIALAIGCDGERCSSIKHSSSVQSKYTMKCNSCGTESPSHKKRKRKASCSKCYPHAYNEKYVLEQIQNY